jgi:hypothetical protein
MRSANGGSSTQSLMCLTVCVDGCFGYCAPDMGALLAPGYSVVNAVLGVFFPV